MTDRPFTLYEGSEHHSRSFTFVEDPIDVYVAVLNQYQTAIGHIFNIGSDLEFTTGEGIALVEEILGKPAEKVIVPKRPGDQLRTCANIAKAKNMLGYVPKTRLKDGLAVQAAWFEEKLKAGAFQ